MGIEYTKKQHILRVRSVKLPFHFQSVNVNVVVHWFIKLEAKRE